jgi:mono/diheme cytochrome c family protein
MMHRGRAPMKKELKNGLDDGPEIPQAEYRQELQDCAADADKYMTERDAMRGQRDAARDELAEANSAIEQITESLCAECHRLDAEVAGLREALEKIKQKCLGHAKDPEMEIDKIYEIAENALAGGQGEGETRCNHPEVAMARKDITTYCSVCGEELDEKS